MQTMSMLCPWMADFTSTMGRGNGPQPTSRLRLHSLGMAHEQARPDRDEYVTVLWQRLG